MNIVLLSIFVAMAAGEMCVRLLGNYEETRIVRRIPGRIWRWNRNTREFEELEALRMNDTALCSVDVADDLRGKTIVVATEMMKPYIIPNANNTYVTGFIGDVWNTLGDALKFKTIYRRAGRSASQTLMNGQAHALLITTAFYSYTSSYYTYSTPIATNFYALFVPSESTGVSKWWYSRIFSPELWITSFAFVICIAAVIMGIFYLKKSVCEDYAECDDELSSVSFDVLFVLGGISGQGFPKFPASWSLRLVIVSHLIMGMLLSGGFNSTLTSYLAIHGNSVPFSNLQDVVKKRTHSLCVRNDSGAYIHFTVTASADGDLIDDWKDLINKGCPDMRESTTLSSQLCKPGFAYLEAPDVFLPVYRQVRQKCRFVQMPEVYWSLKLAFLHARSSRHRRIIDLYLMRLRSAGILKYFENKWISNAIHELEDNQWNTFQPVEHAHIHLASMALLMMMMVSVIICIFENIWYTFLKRFGRIRPETKLPDESNRKFARMKTHRENNCRIIDHWSAPIIEDPVYPRKIVVR